MGVEDQRGDGYIWGPHASQVLQHVQRPCAERNTMKKERDGHLGRSKESKRKRARKGAWSGTQGIIYETLLRIFVLKLREAIEYIGV